VSLLLVFQGRSTGGWFWRGSSIPRRHFTSNGFQLSDCFLCWKKVL